MEAEEEQEQRPHAWKQEEEVIDGLLRAKQAGRGSTNGSPDPVFSAGKRRRKAERSLRQETQTRTTKSLRLPETLQTLRRGDGRNCGSAPEGATERRRRAGNLRPRPQDVTAGCASRLALQIGRGGRIDVPKTPRTSFLFWHASCNTKGARTSKPTLATSSASFRNKSVDVVFFLHSEAAEALNL